MTYSVTHRTLSATLHLAKAGTTAKIAFTYGLLGDVPRIRPKHLSHSACAGYSVPVLPATAVC
jgi:hypothetical protein